MTLLHSLVSLGRTRAFWWSLLVCWGGTVFLLSALPGSSMPQVNIANFDKVEHTICFAVGAGLLTFALGTTFPGMSWRKRIALAAAAISFSGWLDEWHQTFTPGRSGDDVYDWLADTFGALIGAVAAYRIQLYAGKLPVRRDPARRATHQDPAA